MATFFNILVLSFVLTFVLYLGYAGDYTKYGTNSTVETQAYLDQMNGIKTGVNNLPTLFGALTLVAFIGTVIFPNPYTIFFLAFTGLVALVSVPVTVIQAGGMPDIIKQGLTGLFVVMGIYLAVTWYKGQTG